MFTVAGLTQKFSDILTYRYVDPATFNADDSSQVRGGEGRGGTYFVILLETPRFSVSVNNLIFSKIIICV